MEDGHSETVGSSVQQSGSSPPRSGSPQKQPFASGTLHVLQAVPVAQQRLDRSDPAGGVRYAVNDISTPMGHNRHNNWKKHFKNRQKVDDLEKKLNNLKLDTEKNPISKLHEIMMLKNKKVEFTLVSVEGPIHNQKFTFSAKSDDIIVHSVGSSKKEAMKNVAITFMDKMEFSNGNNNKTSNNVPCTTNPINVNFESLSEYLSEINPIGKLQEMCMAYHWQLPSYELGEKLDGDTFLVFCTLFHHKSEGKGKTYKLAKQEAARHMNDKVKDLSEEEIVSHKPSNVLQISDKLEIDRQENMSLSSSNLLETYVNQLKLSSNSSINYLMSTNSVEQLQMYPIDLLRRIGAEEGFSVTCVLLNNDQSMSFSVLIQVTTTPIIVNVSTGNTLIQAKNNAASSALLYLKIILEK